MLAAIKDKTGLLFRKGFFHIFGANVINKCIAFVTNIAITWFLSKEAYGVFSYANSIYSIALLFTGLGLLTGMFQFCLEERKDDERRAIYSYALTRGLAFDLVVAIGLLLVGYFVPLSIEDAGLYLAMFGPMVLLDYCFQYASTALRIRLENQKFAILQTTNTALYFVGGCCGAWLGGVAGTIAGRYFAYAASLLVAALFLNAVGFSIRRSSHLGKTTKREMWRYSLSTQTSSAINQLTYLLDVFLVGVFVAQSASVASYRVATLIPEGLLFIPSSVIMFASPYFVKHNSDQMWFAGKCRLFLAISAGLYFGIAILLFVLAPHLIEMAWGAEYLDATMAFRLLSVSFAFSAIRTTCTNLLCTIRAVRENLMVSIVSLAINVALCAILIPRLGIEGAAAAPMSVSIIAAFVALVLLRRAVAKIGCEQ